MTEVAWEKGRTRSSLEHILFRNETLETRIGHMRVRKGSVEEGEGEAEVLGPRPSVSGSLFVGDSGRPSGVNEDDLDTVSVDMFTAMDPCRRV
jgi:hypothetical protein